MSQIIIYHHTVQVARVQVEYVHQWVEGKRLPGQVATGGTTTGCRECLYQWLKEKRHQRKLQPVTTTMCASGVLVLVDRWITQVQGAKVRVQSAKVRTEGTKVSAQVGQECSNNIQL